MKSYWTVRPPTPKLVPARACTHMHARTHAHAPHTHTHTHTHTHRYQVVGPAVYFCHSSSVCQTGYSSCVDLRSRRPAAGLVESVQRLVRQHLWSGQGLHFAELEYPRCHIREFAADRGCDLLGCACWSRTTEAPTLTSRKEKEEGVNVFVAFNSHWPGGLHYRRAQQMGLLWHCRNRLVDYCVEARGFPRRAPPIRPTARERAPVARCPLPIMGNYQAPQHSPTRALKCLV